MDLGDIIVLAFILFGALSSLVGGKKRRPPSKPDSGTDQPASSPPARADTPESDSASPASIEDILRQLGWDAPTEPADPEAEPEVLVPETAPVSVPDYPIVVSMEGESLEGESLEGPTLETLEPAGGASHKRFHDLYMAAPPVRTAGERKRAAILNPTNLRQAILLHEILGPPKGLQ